MRVVGRIFLLITGILFLVWGVSNFVTAVQYLLAWCPEGVDLTSWAIEVGIKFAGCGLYIFGGLGGIFSFLGIGPFRGWVPILAIIILIYLIVDIVFSFRNGTGFGWLLGVSTVTEVLYFLGWLFARRRN